MNINIDDKAYQYILKKGGALVVKTATSNCGWAGSVKSLWIEASKGVDNEKFYSLYNFKEIKIYIHQSIKVEDTIDIKLKAKIPIIGPLFNIKGVFMN